MSMAPGKHDQDGEVLWQRDLQADLDRLRTQYGIDRLVCLLEVDELEQLNIPDLLGQTRAHGIAAEHFPVPDDGLPDSMESFTALVDRVTAAVKSGETVLIHCKGGQGRTGMLTAAILVELGATSENAIALVRQSRTGALSTEIKRSYVHRFAAQKL
jgi:protein-tyrosine phosphatase